jgi:hypothetical protein
MKTVLELLGPPAVGKTSLAGSLRDGMSVVAEQVCALLLTPDPPPPGPERQAVIGRRIAAEVAARPAGPVMLDLGWVSLICFAYAEWSAVRAHAVAETVAETAREARGCRYAGLVVLSADEAELRRRAAADADTGRHRGGLDRNLARLGREEALLHTAETVLPPGMVLRPRSSDVTGRAAEVRAWLAAGGPTMDPAELLLCLAEAWLGTPRATGRRARP